MCVGMGAYTGSAASEFNGFEKVFFWEINKVRLECITLEIMLMIDNKSLLDFLHWCTNLGNQRHSFRDSFYSNEGESLCCKGYTPQTYNLPLWRLGAQLECRYGCLQKQRGKRQK